MRKRAIAGGRRASAIVEDSPNSDYEQGISATGMARLVMAAIILFGSYLGMLFPVSWAVAASPTTNLESVASAPRKPIKETSGHPNKEVVSPVPGFCGDVGLDPESVPPTKGIWGSVYAYGLKNRLMNPSQLNGSVINVLNANSGALVASTEPIQGSSAFNFSKNYGQAITNSIAITTLTEYVIEINPVSAGGLKGIVSYFSYGDVGGSGIYYGRYSRYAASRLVLDSDCTTYVIADQQAWPEGAITKTLTLRNGGGTRVGVQLNINSVDLAVAYGRGVGGRVFMDTGQTINNANQPPVFYNSGIIVDLYPLVGNGIYTTTGAITGINVDNEGFYTIAGINSGVGADNPVIPDTVARNFRLAYRKAGDDGIATMLSCNQLIPESTDILSGNDLNANTGPYLIGINFTPLSASQVSTFTDDISYTPNLVNASPPCRTKNNNGTYDLSAIKTLQGSGIHAVVRQNRAIVGKVLDNSNNGVQGATVQAIRSEIAQTGGQIAVEGTAQTGADGSFSIKGLRPNTNYFLKALPPTGAQLVGEYYNNVEFDHTLTDNDNFGGLIKVQTSGVGVGQPVTTTISPNIQLQQGWFFKGTVTLGAGEGSINVKVLVFRASDLTDPNVDFPQPIDQAVINTLGSFADYQTKAILIPGESYVINFVPQGVSAEYKAGWCGVRTGNNCSFATNAQGAVAITITPSSGGFPARTAGIQADVSLAKGVSLKGTVRGQLANGTATNLSNPQTPVNIYVYEVGLSGSIPVTSSLVQFLQVVPAGSTVDYQTAALVENSNYVLRFVPSIPTGDPGYRSAYYKSGVITGVTELSLASTISQSVPGAYAGYDINLVRTGGAILTIYTAEGLLFNNVRIEAYAAGKSTGTGTPSAVAVTGQNGKAELPGLLSAEGPFTFKLSLVGSRGVSVTEAVDIIDGIFISKVYTMPRFAAFSGQVTPSNEDWTGTKLLVKTITGTTYGVFTPQATGTYTITKLGSIWFWDAFLPPGSYYFALVPTNTNKYLKHWYVGNATDQAGANENLAKIAEVITGTSSTGLDIGFYEGGLMRVKVEDLEGNPIPDVLVGFYTEPTFSPGNIIYSNFSNASGIAYSRAYSGPVNIRGVPGTTAAVITGTLINDYILDGQELTRTLRLSPAPEVTGFVKMRRIDNTEVFLQNIEVELVDATNNTKLNSNIFKTDASGSYRFKMPSIGFKIKFKANPGAGLPEDLYYMDGPRKTGTKDFELATTVYLIGGKKLTNYNLVYDPSPQPNQGCRITDAYVLNTTTTSAQIQFYSNCRGTGIIAYGFSPKPYSSTIGVYGTNLITETVSGQGSFTHTITMNGLDSSGNYYVRPFLLESNNYTGAEKELLVKTAATGLNWYFPGGNISQNPVSGTEVLHIFNPNSQVANVTITYYYNSNQDQNSGPTMKTRQLQVAAQTQVEIAVHNPAEPLSLAADAFFGRHSTGVVADRQIVVERTQSVIDKNAQNYYTFGSYKIQGLTALANNWYFPHVADVSTTQQVVSLLNSNAITVCVKLFYYHPNSSLTNTLIVKPTPGQQSTAADYIVINPNGRYDFFTTDSRLGPGTSESVYALRVTTFSNVNIGCQSLPIVADTEYRYVDVNSKGYEKGISSVAGAPAPSQRWYFMENASDKNYDIIYHIMSTNMPAPGETITKVITLTAYIDNPTPGGLATTKQYTKTVLAGQRVNFTAFSGPYNQPAPGQSLGYTMLVESEVPIVVVRQVKYFYNVSADQRGMYHEMGTTRAAKTHIFPGNNTINDPVTRYDSSVDFTVYNPAPVPVTLNVSYYTATGQLIFNNGLLKLPPYGRIQIQPLSQGSNYPGIGPNKSFTIKIESVEGTGIIVERSALYTKGNINGGGASYGYMPSDT